MPDIASKNPHSPFQIILLAAVTASTGWSIAIPRDTFCAALLPLPACLPLLPCRRGIYASLVAFIGCLGLIGANSAGGMLAFLSYRFLVSGQPAAAIMPPSRTRVCPTTQAAARDDR